MSRTVPVLVTLALLAAACRTPLGPARPLAPGDTRPAAFVAALVRDAQTRRALRALTKFSVDGPAGSGRAKQLLVVERPARLRVEILGFLNQTVALLVTDQGRYRFFRSEDRSLQEGPVYRELLDEVAGVGLTPEEAVDVLLGAPAPPPSLRLGRGVLLPDGTLRVDGTTVSGALRRRFEFDAQARLRRLEVHGVEGLLWDARFDDYRRVGEVAFAHTLELRFPPSGTRAEVSFRDVELNPDLPPDVFVLKLPAAAAGVSGGRG